MITKDKKLAAEYCEKEKIIWQWENGAGQVKQTEGTSAVNEQAITEQNNCNIGSRRSKEEN